MFRSSAPGGFNITCVSSIGAAKVTAPFVLSSRLPPPTQLMLPRAGGLPCKFSKKSSPLRNSAQMELICGYGMPVQFKRKTGLAQPSLLSPGESSCQLPKPATSVVGRCGRGPTRGPGGRPPPRSCNPPFQRIPTAHLAHGAVVGPWRPGVAG